jgi:hypothetical protein
VRARKDFGAALLEARDTSPEITSMRARIEVGEMQPSSRGSFGAADTLG